jgi:hypothetical protein
MSPEGLWWTALALGAVVLLVAVGLLEWFTRLVERIEDLAERIWQTGKQVAANTATTWQLTETSRKLDALADEAGRHGQLLEDTKRGP